MLLATKDQPHRCNAPDVHLPWGCLPFGGAV